MWQRVTAQIAPRVWVSAGVASALLLGLVLSQVDMALLKDAVQTLSWYWFAAALLLLQAEGFLTAQRMQVFTPGQPPYTACLRISAWFVLFLMLLPARLGEVVSVVLLRRFAGQKAGPALANLLTQRIFDVLVLITVFIMLALVIAGLPLGFVAFAASICAFVLLAALVLVLDRILALAARLINALRRRSRARLLRQLLRVTVQARSWRRHHMTRAVARNGLAVTLLKWVANLGGLTLLFVAFRIPVDLTQALLLAASFNLLAIVPLQTVGGIGVGEVGLSGLLMLFGTSVEYAASMSILVRAVLIVSPLLYWALIMSATAAMPRRRGDSENR